MGDPILTERTGAAPLRAAPVELRARSARPLFPATACRSSRSGA
jgi:hypothetical protein